MGAAEELMAVCGKGTAVIHYKPCATGETAVIHYKPYATGECVSRTFFDLQGPVVLGKLVTG